MGVHPPYSCVLLLRTGPACCPALSWVEHVMQGTIQGRTGAVRLPRLACVGLHLTFMHMQTARTSESCSELCACLHGAHLRTASLAWSTISVTLRGRGNTSTSVAVVVACTRNWVHRGRGPAACLRLRWVPIRICC